MAQTSDDIDLLTQVASGDLSGTLSTGDKLIALSNLMRSMTRSGRRAGLNPGEVMEKLQQQKMAEIQNRLKVEQLRRDAAAAAQMRALRLQLTSKLTPDQQAEANLLSDEAFMQVYGERLKGALAPKEATQSSIARQITEATGFPPGDPRHRSLMAQYLAQGRYMQTPEGLAWSPGLDVGGAPPPPPAPSAAPAGAMRGTPRPEGMSDEQLRAYAEQAIARGADPNEVMAQLNRWGVGL